MIYDMDAVLCERVHVFYSRKKPSMVLCISDKFFK
jgi:hypothetical protein